VSGANVKLKPIMQPLDAFKERALFLHGLDGHFVVAGGLCDEGPWSYGGMWTTVGKRFPSTTAIEPMKTCMSGLPEIGAGAADGFSIEEFINASTRTPLPRFNVSARGFSSTFTSASQPRNAHGKLVEAYKANPALPYADIVAGWSGRVPEVEGMLQLATVALGSDLVDAAGVDVPELPDNNLVHMTVGPNPDPEGVAAVQKMQTEMAASIANVMRLMKGMVYGKGNLLDHTVVVWLSGLHALGDYKVKVSEGSFPWRSLHHSRSDLSVVLFIPPTLAIRTPRQMRLPPRALGLPLHRSALPQSSRPLVDLWVTLLNAMKIGAKDFGDPALKPSVITELLNP
jgi:hypothetical protein